MRVFLAAILLIGLGVFGMCFNIIFRKDGEFPNSDVGSNKEMRKLGIRCMKDEMDDIPLDGSEPRRGVCSGTYDESCKSCGLYEIEKTTRP